MLNEDIFQMARTPPELRDFIQQIREKAENDPEERERAFLKRGLYKKFFDELVPLSDFCSCNYPDSYRIKPVLGNQGFDAIIYTESDVEVEKIEITVPHDGEWAAADGRALVKYGVGLGEVGTPGDELEPFIEFALETCRAKAQNDYGDCVLVIALSPWPVPRGFERQFDVSLEVLVEDLKCVKYIAKKVFLLIQPNRLVLIQD